MGKEKMYYEELGYEFDPPFYAPTSKPIVTNYDRIISKTPEELAEFLYEFFGCSMNCPVYDACDPQGSCTEFLAKWLQQEAK